MKTYVLKSVIKFSLCIILALIPLLSVSAVSASAKEDVAKFPTRPITFVSPLVPGASVDLSLRLIAKEAEKFLGQPLVIVNKPGGSFTVGPAAISSANPDGYTIGFTPASSLVITPFLEKIPYDPLKDFQQIMQFGETNFGVVVKGDSSFKNFKDLVDYARKNPKKVTFGTSGAANIGRLVVEQIAKKEGVQFVNIPFKGSPETEAALLGGHITFFASGFSNAQLEAGETRLLLFFADERRAAYPQIPILKDLGYNFPCPMAINVAGPKGLPKEIVKKLEDAFTRAMKEPAFIKGMKEIQLPIVYRNSRELTDYVALSHENFAKILKDLGLSK